MYCQHLLLDVVDQVLAWDLPEEALAEAVAAQARQLAGVDSDDPGVSPLD